MAASNLYYSAGQPSDSTGASGDFNWDTTNRIFWGPKTAGGTWVGTGNSVAGPAGAAMLAGNGAPASSYGSNGQGYCDTSTGLTYYKSSNAWAQTGSIVGPTGQAGPCTLLTQSVGMGQAVATTATLSSTPTTLTFPGNSVVPVISYSYANAFMGGIFLNQSSASATFNLIDTTNNSAVIYTTNVAASTASVLGQFTATAYPMPANHSFQWQMTGSAAAAGSYVSPFYLFPAASPSYNISVLPMCGKSSASATYSGTYNALYLGAATVTYTFKNYKACSLYTVNVYNQTNASITVGMANYTASNFLWNLGTVAANSFGTFGPYAIGTYAFTAGSSYYWSASGSGTGAVYVDSAVCYSAS